MGGTFGPGGGVRGLLLDDGDGGAEGGEHGEAVGLEVEGVGAGVADGDLELVDGGVEFLEVEEIVDVRGEVVFEIAGG